MKPEDAALAPAVGPAATAVPDLAITDAAAGIATVTAAGVAAAPSSAMASAAVKPVRARGGHGHHEDDGAPRPCPNCGATASGNYCHNCGQETRMHAPSFMEFAHEFIGHYVALEGRLWGTFARLLFRPGALTNEYMAGRRKRYVEPLRLYLTLSILFFALLKFTGTEVINLGDGYNPRASSSEAANAAKAARHAARQTEKQAAKEAEAIRKEGVADGAVVDQSGKEVLLEDQIKSKVPWVAERVEHFRNLSPEALEKAVSDGFYHYAPYAMFALMPLFALYLKVLYMGSGRRYGEHLLFALHSSSFAFVMFAAIKLSDSSFITLVLICWLVGYLPWAMRRVYHSSRMGTLLRWTALMFAHGISLGLAIVLAAGAGAASVH